MKCYELHADCNKECQKQACRFWIQSNSHQNCTLIAARQGPMSLQQIGDILQVTRMRICQIEKKVIEKLANHIL